MELLKLLSASEIVAQIISFLLLLLLLRIFAWRKLLKLLDDRKSRIASEFKKIEEAKLTIEKLRAEYEARLKSIEDTARDKIQQAITEAHKQKDEIKKDAHLEAQKIIENAQANIKFELDKAKESLRDEIIGLVLSATENIIAEKLTPEEDRKLVEDFLNSIDKAP